MVRIIRVYDGSPGWGYEVSVNDVRIVQTFAPALPGSTWMTFEQATILGNFVEAKMNAGLMPSITVEQIDALWNNLKTPEQLIAEEIEYLASLPKIDIALPGL